MASWFETRGVAALRAFRKMKPPRRKMR